MSDATALAQYNRACRSIKPVNRWVLAVSSRPMFRLTMTTKEQAELQHAFDKLTDYMNSSPSIVDQCINAPSLDSAFGQEFSDESALTTGAAAAAYLHVALQHLGLAHAALSADGVFLLPIVNTLRAALEASSRAYWLLDPSLDKKKRIARGLIERIAALESQQKVRADAVHLKRRAEDIRAIAQSHGISVQGQRTGSHLPRKIGGESRPDASSLAAAILGASGKRGGSSAGWLYGWMSAYAHSALWTALDMRTVRKTEDGSNQIAVTADAKQIAAALVLVIEAHAAAVRRLAHLAGRLPPGQRAG
jgi:hypothetical protein